MNRRSVLGAILAVLLLTAAGCGGGGGGGVVKLHHIHGLGYSADGANLYVPAHDGLRIYAGGAWKDPGGPRHDYMGFVTVADGFYTSGHPDPKSKLPEPLGLMHSPDWGKSLVPLGFQGQIDFHMMGVGYRSKAIYVENHHQAPGMGAGFFRSLDGGKTWQKAALQGINAQTIQIAVHPTEPNTVALATAAGLMLSRDGGERVERVGPEGVAVSAAFSPDGKTLYSGGFGLQAVDMASGKITVLPAPALAERDGFTYIAVNPARPDEIAVATAQRHIFLRQPSGEWLQIARAGEGLR